MAKTTGQWLKQRLKVFKPNNAQRMAKERLLSAMEELEGQLDMESLSITQIVNLTGCSEIEKWVDSDASFLPWILDTDHQSHRLKALFDKGLDEMESILDSDYEPKILTAKDKIAVFNILAQLADKQPAKRKEVKWIDESVGQMEDTEVAKELAKARQKLLGASVKDSEKKA